MWNMRTLALDVLGQSPGIRENLQVSNQQGGQYQMPKCWGEPSRSSNETLKVRVKPRQWSEQGKSIDQLNSSR